MGDRCQLQYISRGQGDYVIGFAGAFEPGYNGAWPRDCVLANGDWSYAAPYDTFYLWSAGVAASGEVPYPVVMLDNGDFFFSSGGYYLTKANTADVSTAIAQKEIDTVFYDAGQGFGSNVTIKGFGQVLAENMAANRIFVVCKFRAGANPTDQVGVIEFDLNLTPIRTSEYYYNFNNNENANWHGAFIEDGKLFFCVLNYVDRYDLTSPNSISVNTGYAYHDVPTTYIESSTFSWAAKKQAFMYYDTDLGVDTVFTIDIVGNEIDWAAGNAFGSFAARTQCTVADWSDYEAFSSYRQDIANYGNGFILWGQRSGTSQVDIFKIYWDTLLRESTQSFVNVAAPAGPWEIRTAAGGIGVTPFG